MQQMHQQVQSGESESVGLVEYGNVQALNSERGSPPPKVGLTRTFDALHVFVPEPIMQVDRNGKIPREIVAGPSPRFLASHRRAMAALQLAHRPVSQTAECPVSALYLRGQAPNVYVTLRADHRIRRKLRDLAESLQQDQVDPFTFKRPRNFENGCLKPYEPERKVLVIAVHSKPYQIGQVEPRMMAEQQR